MATCLASMPAISYVFPMLSAIATIGDVYSSVLAEVHRPVL